MKKTWIRMSSTILMEQAAVPLISITTTGQKYDIRRIIIQFIFYNRMQVASAQSHCATIHIREMNILKGEYKK